MYLVFPLVLLLMSVPTVFWWVWLDERLAAGFAAPRRPSCRKLWRRGLARSLLAGYTATVLLPVALLLVARWADDALPVPILMWVMIWHLAALVVGTLVFAGWSCWRIAARLRTLPLIWGERTPPSPEPAPGVPPAPMSRRAFLTGALTVTPVLLSGGAVASGLRQQGRFAVRRMNINLPRLPDRLQGLTITHLSDLHVGRLFRPEHLHRVVEAANKLDSDIVAITGDTVDHSADFLPAACDAFGGLRSRYGRFTVIGNHDLIDSPDQAVRYLARREPHFMRDECRRLEIGGEILQIAGLFWSRYDHGKSGLPGHRDRVDKAMGHADPGVFTLALAHHPHAFDALSDAGVDLTLAGHTHGGQLMITTPGAQYPIGGGSLLFRYIWGEYRRGRSAMYVTSGVGNWFPVRINAPAEIVQVRLV